MTKITVESFKKALKGSGGIQSKIAAKLDVTRGAVSIFISKNKKMKKLLEEEAEKIIDMAESNVFKDIADGNVDTSKWKLTNSKRGKERGYGFKQEIEHSGEIKGETKLQLEIVDNVENEDGSSDEDSSKK